MKLPLTPIAFLLTFPALLTVTVEAIPTNLDGNGPQGLVERPTATALASAISFTEPVPTVQQTPFPLSLSNADRTANDSLNTPRYLFPSPILAKVNPKWTEATKRRKASMDNKLSAVIPLLRSSAKLAVGNPPASLKYIRVTVKDRSVVLKVKEVREEPVSSLYVSEYIHKLLFSQPEGVQAAITVETASAEEFSTFKATGCDL